MASSRLINELFQQGTWKEKVVAGGDGWVLPGVIHYIQSRKKLTSRETHGNVGPEESRLNVLRFKAAG